ncbi:hypothetical protein CRI93_11030 [Longimonas halophila]|uniref:Uncharacterized protein n=1 Tax=Longimonas halophila TaxID=1469170 RepID=A0A2H3NVR9_9BACT|nr:hypothetical protein [Longimonas halophila]PEN06007.1 hypothetical protein CRI93_11030 [Longimonas halophila]
MLLPALLIPLAGCATSSDISTSYNANENQTLFETDPIRITRGGSGLGSSGEQIIYIKGQAECQGQNCTPNSVRILLSSATRNVSWLDYDNVTISTDSWSRTWNNVSTREDPELVGIGEFMRLTMPIDEFRQLLRSRGMSIQIGSTDINLSFNQMRPLREMMVAMSPDQYDSTDDVANSENEDDVV